MKNLLFVIALLVAANSIAQLPADSMFANDISMLTKFLPGSESDLSNAAYQMEPQSFISQLDSFKNFAYASADLEQNAQKKELRKKDVDDFAKLILSAYARNYGVDSIKTGQYYELLSKNENPDSATEKMLDSLYTARFTKKLSNQDSLMLDSMIFSGTDLRDSVLFVNSTAHKQMVKMTLRRIEEEKYPDTTNDGSAFRPAMLNEVLKDGYVFESFTYDNIDFIVSESKDSALVARAYERYMAKAKNTAFRTRAETAYKNFRALEKNSPAPDFVFRDINGKTVTLKQLRGKYIYIDIWATWCIPCKLEIPFLSKLEEDYAGKKISFISLSVDKQEDKPIWAKYVKAKKLKGIQVIADKDLKSDFIKKLNVSSIPRFILIDPAGKFVDANAMRPSDGDLRKQLDELL